MKAGKVGVLVLMVSLMGMLGVSWVMSMDVVMTEKTTYTEVTEITPLFGSQQMPQYTDYSPSTNYTGYWTDATVLNGTKYFGGVDYTPSPRANNYSIWELGDVGLDTTIDLADYTGTYPFTDPDTRIIYAYVDPLTGFNQAHSNTSATIYSLSSYITALNLDSDINNVAITSTVDIDPDDIVHGAQADVDWILFSVTSQWRYQSSVNTMAVGTPEWFTKNNIQPGYYNELNGMTYTLPAISATYDKTTNLVTLFADKDCQERLGSYDLSDVVISFGGSGSGNVYFNMGDTADILAITLDRNYLDPSKGVELA